MLKFTKAAEEAPCKEACPAGIDIPRYIRSIREGKFDNALAVIREKIPFPSVCGRVCFRPCEVVCQARYLGGPVGVNALKRFVAEQVPVKPAEGASFVKPSGKRVAIVGSGPAGLTAAYYLAKLGHGVTVFEKLPEAGGTMRFGIPAYRLPIDVLNSEIDAIIKIGVEIKTGTKIESLNDLVNQGYGAVFVAVGAHKSVRMGIEGEDDPAVMDVISFLRRVNSGERAIVGNRVVVAGG
ncbi:MAG: FAD-dependent oxidoreductase, partial [Syntrophales bacterium]|nr:FAD-dependent oxidoreductase [Syntrophales bacterium]